MARGRRLIVWILVLLAVALLAYVRFAPTDYARWHTVIAAEADKDMVGGAIRIVDAPAGSLVKLNDIALATPRTTLVAGSVEDGRVTYETRSRLIGFPDYTTVEEVDGSLRMFARSRFGRSDFGVNRARLEDWIARLKN